MTDPMDDAEATHVESETPIQDQVQQAMIALNAQGSQGAKWFYWIAGLSLVNTAIVHTGGQIQFIVGLAVTLIADVIASEVGKTEPELATILMVVAIGFSIVISVIACLFGWLSQRRFLWIFGLGMFLYLLDGLIFVLIGEYFSAAFHGYALYSMFQGFNAYRQLNQLEQAVQPASPDKPAPVAGTGF